MNEAKENWLFAWSIIRTCRNGNFPKQPKKISKLLSKAQEIAEKKELVEAIEYRNLLSRKIEFSIRDKYRRMWTGHKWTWIEKIEEDDLPF